MPPVTIRSLSRYLATAILRRETELVFGVDKPHGGFALGGGDGVAGQDDPLARRGAEFADYRRAERPLRDIAAAPP